MGDCKSTEETFHCRKLAFEFGTYFGDPVVLRKLHLQRSNSVFLIHIGNLVAVLS
jgi:hypothetical protein